MLSPPIAFAIPHGANLGLVEMQEFLMPARITDLYACHACFMKWCHSLGLWKIVRYQHHFCRHEKVPWQKMVDFSDLKAFGVNSGLILEIP
jgi:hypothetical protein